MSFLISHAIITTSSPSTNSSRAVETTISPIAARAYSDGHGPWPRSGWPLAGALIPNYSVAFYAAVAQTAIGFLLLHAVNPKPKDPGIVVAFHQGIVLKINLAIVAVGHCRRRQSRFEAVRASP